MTDDRSPCWLCGDDVNRICWCHEQSGDDGLPCSCPDSPVGLD